MPTKNSTSTQKPEPHTKYHKDGTVWAKGFVLDGVPIGYWEWFRKDGSRVRSGTFENGEQSASGRPMTARARSTK